MAPRPRLERGTFRLGGGRSIQLSYRGVRMCSFVCERPEIKPAPLSRQDAPLGSRLGPGHSPLGSRRSCLSEQYSDSALRADRHSPS